MRILLVVYDNGSYVSWFPQGLAYIASALRNKGHEIVIYNQDVYHLPESHLKDYLDNEVFDVVGVSVIGGYYQYKKLLNISEAINNAKNRPFYMIGGHGPAPEPEYFLRKTMADVVVIGEGEITCTELMDVLRDGKDLSIVKGIAYKKSDGTCVINEKRELIKNIDEIAFPAWDLFPIDHYSMMRISNIANSDRCMPVLSGRGCPFECNFCYRMDKGFRPRSVNNIIEEISVLKKDYGITAIAFSDELLMSSRERTIEICEGLIRSNLNIKWDCNGRLNFADTDVLKVMKEAGCVFINYGIESMDQKILNVMKKGLSVKMIYKGIENTLNAGISPGFNIIFGNIGETKEALQSGVDFLLKYDDHSQMRTIRPVTPYPGSPLYYYAIENNLLKDCEDFYENKHINSDLLSVNFTDMSDDDFHESLFDANKVLISNYFEFLKTKAIGEARKLYFEKNSNFRGFRQM